jgi:hypothetical protein
VAFVRVHEALDDGKAEAGAAPLGPRALPEAIEDVRDVLGRDAAAGVLHPEEDLAALRRRADGHAAAAKTVPFGYLVEQDPQTAPCP